MLLANKFIYLTYCQNGTYSGNSFHSFYGVKIFSRVPAAFYELDFEESMMGRSLIVCEPLDTALPIVATAHFESLEDYYKLRKIQMEASTNLLNDIQAKTGRSVVLVGDFNFDPEREDTERVLTENGFRDIMSDFVEKDAFSMHKTPRFPPWRPDKITISA